MAGVVQRIERKESAEKDFQRIQLLRRNPVMTRFRAQVSQPMSNPEALERSTSLPSTVRLK